MKNNMEGEVFERSVEIIPNRLYFSVMRFPVYKKLRNTKSTLYLCVDDELKYRNFFNDFGPLNVGCVYKFCVKMNKYLQSFKSKKRVVHYTSSHPDRKVNAAFLTGAFAIICLRMDPRDVYRLLQVTEPYRPFVDALQHTSNQTLRLYDCLLAVKKAMMYNFVNFEDFNVAEYDLYDKLQFGNMNWIVPRKFLALLGPSDSKNCMGHRPTFYVEYFLHHDVKTIIRLNNKLYDANVFTRMGIQHHDLFFDDGTVPPKDILLKFLRIVETAPAAIAVHCKAGLGRTGTLIACYLIKHYRMTAREAIAWLRICRPGSVIGPQQTWLEELEVWLWRLGDEYRMRHYGEGDKIPQHKYGIYSRKWPLERRRIINEAKKKMAEIKFVRNNNSHSQVETTDKGYFKQISKLLTAVRSFDESKSRRSKERILTVIPQELSPTKYI